MKQLFLKFNMTLLLLLVLGVGAAFGDEKISFEASSPMVVANGEAFRVEFSLNAKPDEGSFTPPAFENFDVIAGPAVSQGQSIQVVNGSMSRSVNYTITYVLLPQKNGTFNIGSATIRVDGDSYRTKTFPIEVAGEGESKASVADSPQSKGGSRSTKGQGALSSDDILIRMDVSSRSVFKGAPLVATFKLYRRGAEIVDLQEVKFPVFNGFWTQQIDTQSAQWQRESYNGKVYDSRVLAQYLLYPQQSGALKIEPASMTVVAQVVVPTAGRNPFFGQSHDVYELRRKVKTSPIAVTVRELPVGAPVSFTGAVGRYTMEATPPKSQISANSASTYMVKISGTGNLSFVQAPKLTLPTSFEQYNVKTTESFNTSVRGMNGYRQFEYPFIARSEGEFQIEPVEFSYFDPVAMKYVTLSSPQTTLTVTPGVGGDADADGGNIVRGISREEVKMLGRDIRFLKLGEADLSTPRLPFMLSGRYLVVFFVLIAAFVGAFYVLQRRRKEHRNVSLRRGRAANKVAVQRFKAALKYMNENNTAGFYDEMLRALWGYMSDKFNIPLANLTKDTVREELHKRGVSAEIIGRLSQIVIHCEEAQYSPQASSDMGEVYDDGIHLISKIESIVKH